jgi:hypothetical protein
MQTTAPQNPASSQPLTTAWALRAWPPLLWQATERKPVRFQHLGTHVSPGGGQTGCMAGQTVWTAHAEEGEAGMAWDWVELAHGVVALADPLSVVTNVRLVNAEGEVLTALQAARFINEMVRALPWQQEVERALRRRLN